MVLVCPMKSVIGPTQAEYIELKHITSRPRPTRRKRRAAELGRYVFQGGWMGSVAQFVLVSLLLGACSMQAEVISHDELPDDYLPFTLHQLNGRLEGASEFLDGFKISMNLPSEHFHGGLSIEAVYSLVRSNNVTGTVTYPSGKTTKIEYEIVRHREIEEIYMKSSLGYFLWEYLFIHDGKLNFAIYWWYCPPAKEEDRKILEYAGELLSDSSHWHQNDDRECGDDIENKRWSLFCALKHASMKVAGEYNHHNTAIQSARFVIDELVPNHGFAHTLMDYNNRASTSYSDIMRVLEISRERIGGALNSSQPSDVLNGE